MRTVVLIATSATAKIEDQIPSTVNHRKTTMQDLDVIAKLNSEAHARDIPNQQAKGLYVVAEYHGLHYVGYSTHASEVEANAKACEIGNEVGRRATVYAPTQLAAAVQRAESSITSSEPVDLTGLVSATLPVAENFGTATIVSGSGGDFGGGGASSDWGSSDSSSSDSSSSVSSSD
jgi:hypothetical protein